jgi:hypothetical protein
VPVLRGKFSIPDLVHMKINDKEFVARIAGVPADIPSDVDEYDKAWDWDHVVTV